jgi:hypothetical protein
MADDRTVADVFQDIVRNLQEIVRSEVRLAKAEIRDEAAQAASSALWVGVGAAGALCSAVFLLWTAAYALATMMSMWKATLIVGFALGIVAGALVAVGLRRFKRIRPMPERTIETLKENVEWIKQPTR